MNILSRATESVPTTPRTVRFTVLLTVNTRPTPCRMEIVCGLGDIIAPLFDPPWIATNGTGHIFQKCSTHRNDGTTFPETQHEDLVFPTNISLRKRQNTPSKRQKDNQWLRVVISHESLDIVIRQGAWCDYFICHVCELNVGIILFPHTNSKCRDRVGFYILLRSLRSSIVIYGIQDCCAVSLCVSRWFVIDSFFFFFARDTIFGGVVLYASQYK